MIEVVVTDANIFIDLLALELIDPFLVQDIEIWTTQEVLLELYPHDAELIISYDSIHVQNELDIIHTDKRQFSRHFSVADKSLLRLVSTLKTAILLSGEKRMRSWCKRHNIETHGIIWVLQVLINNSDLSSEQAAFKLKELLIINKWLPMKICLDQIEKWTNEKPVL